MNSDRKKFVWEVELQKPDGTTMKEKISAFWSPTFEGIKEAVAHAARMQAWFRNKKKVEFQVLGEPKLLGRVGDEGVTA